MHPFGMIPQIGPADDLEDISAELATLPFSALSSDDLELFLDVAVDLTAKGGNDSQVSGKEEAMNYNVDVWMDGW